MTYVLAHLGQATTELCYFEGLAKWSNAERWKLVEVATSLGGPPDELSAVIKIETAGKFDPAIKNPTSSASGLIQWIESTAKNLHGLTTAQIRQMSVCQQLELARSYFQKTLPGGRWQQPGDFYLAVAGGPYPAGSPGAQANPGWDLNKDGAVSAAEIRALAVGAQNAACKKPQKIPVTPESCSGGGLLGPLSPRNPLVLAAAGVAAYAAWRYLR